MPRSLIEVDRIVSILSDTPDRLGALSDGLTRPKLEMAPEPGEWSLLEILAHLRACADTWGEAIETILSSHHPTIRAVNPTTWIEHTDYRQLDFSTSLAAFAEQRNRLLSTLGCLSVTKWSRTATVLGGGAPLEISVHAYANRLARHERTHWKQAEKTARAVA